MADIKALYETIKMDAFDLGLSKSKVPDFITDNLKYNPKTNKLIVNNRIIFRIFS